MLEQSKELRVPRRLELVVPYVGRCRKAHRDSVLLQVSEQPLCTYLGATVSLVTPLL